MPYDPERHHRRSVRWRGHDYAAGGTYFVTICVHDRECLFGAVHDGAMRVNGCGLIVEREWVRSGEIREEVEVDIFCVMPNHLHGLVTIRSPVSAHRDAPGHDDGDTPMRPPKSVGTFVGGFKQAATMRINEHRGTPGAPVWQRGFHERVVRDERMFSNVAAYIATNPERWGTDGENPHGEGDDPFDGWLVRP